MATREFIKMHGLENHFAIFDATDNPLNPEPEQVRRWSSVNIGIGAEQIVVISHTNNPQADYQITMYNPDGEIAEACGNATRCVARLLMEKTQQSHLIFQIGDRLLECIQRDNLYQVSMGRVSFDWRDVPLQEPIMSFHESFKSFAVNVGNPHVVLLVKDINSVDKVAIGRQIQQHPALVNSANVGFMQIVSETHLKLQVYERPGILTRACGSGACAAAAIARKNHLIAESTTRVEMPGGDLLIDFTDSYDAIMTGPASYCFTGTVEE